MNWMPQLVRLLVSEGVTMNIKKTLKYIIKNRNKFTDFDPHEFAIGIQVEFEHTDDPEEASQIASDHLNENGKYYSKLMAARLVDEELKYTKVIENLLRAGEKMEKARSHKYLNRTPDGKGHWNYTYPGEMAEGKFHHDTDVHPQAQKKKLEIIEKVDTRQYDEEGPVSGSGDVNSCHFCGKDHEVHYHVSDGEKQYIVGSSCAKKMGVPEKEINRVDREHKKFKEVERYKKLHDIYTEIEKKSTEETSIEIEVGIKKDGVFEPIDADNYDKNSFVFISDKNTGIGSIVVNNNPDRSIKITDERISALRNSVVLKKISEEFKNKTGKESTSYFKNPIDKFNLKKDEIESIEKMGLLIKQEKSLFKARSHKYLWRKPDGKGHWIYGYPEDKNHHGGTAKPEAKKETTAIKITEGGVENSHGFVNFSVQDDPIFDDKGNETGSEKYVLIDLIKINKEERGRGYAKKLLAEAIQEAKKEKLPIKLVALPKEKDIDQDRLVSFYESMGFSVDEEHLGGSGIIMELNDFDKHKKYLSDLQTVYVAPEETKTGWIQSFMDWFGFTDKGQANKRLEKDYKDNAIDKQGLNWDGWKSHVAEYFQNKDKWDRFFSGEKKEKKETPKQTDKKIKKQTGKTPGTAKFKLSVMKVLHGLYGVKPAAPPVTPPSAHPITPPAKAEAPAAPSPDNFDTMPEGTTGKKDTVEPATTLTKAEENEIKSDEEQAARDGYYNEKPAEILNVGQDVMGAARHNFTTYQALNVDVKSMEKDGTAEAYVTKKNLFGDYGLANKDGRVSKGETEYKVLASFAIHEYLAKAPTDNPENREKYMDFCRAIQRLDQNTTDSETFYRGLAETFSTFFPPSSKKQDTMGQGINILDLVPATVKDSQKAENVLGKPLAAFMYSLSNDKQAASRAYYSLDKKEGRQFKVLMSILLSESGKEVRTPKEIETMIFGEVKIAGIKLKKGDFVIITDELKNKIYRRKSEFKSPEDKKRHEDIREKLNEYYLKEESIKHSLYANTAIDAYNKAYGTNFSERNEVIENINQETKKLREESKDCLNIETLYPIEKGQIVKAGKDSIDVSFKFADGQTYVFEKLKPSLFNQENIESVSKDIKRKQTKRIDLYIESRVDRKGGKDFDGLTVRQIQEKLSSEVQFKAIQYGNTMPDVEREYHTKWALQSMSDLSEILNIPLEQITARGKLGIAFGARGQGGQPGASGMGGALAHYESLTKMINLTRANGYGSLAHEWGHFMDNILSSDKSFISYGPSREKMTISHVEDVPHGSIHTIMARKKQVRYYFDKNAKNPQYPFACLDSGQNEPNEKSRYVQFKSYSFPMEFDVPQNIRHEQIANEIAKIGRQSLQEQTEKELSGMKEGTMDYMLNYELTKGLLDDPYYNSNHECFARAFEAYVADKLENSGRMNTYLSSKEKTTKMDATMIYPQGEHREKINKLFDEFFDEIRARDEMKKALDRINS